MRNRTPGKEKSYLTESGQLEGEDYVKCLIEFTGDFSYINLLLKDKLVVMGEVCVLCLWKS